MLYDAYEVQRSLLAGASRVASVGAGWLNNPANPLSYGSMGPIAAAALDVFAHASAPRGKPKGSVPSTTVITVYNGAEEKLSATIDYLEKTFGVKAKLKNDPTVPVDVVVTVGGTISGYCETGRKK